MEVHFSLCMALIVDKVSGNKDGKTDLDPNANGDKPPTIIPNM